MTSSTALSKPENIVHEIEKVRLIRLFLISNWLRAMKE